MDSAAIKDCWGVVRQADPTLLAQVLLPLPDLQGCLESYSLAPLPPMQMATAATLDVNSIEPGFKNATEEMLLTLRRHACAGTELDSVSRWAEKLLRFCELRHRTLKERAVRACGSKATAQLRLLHLGAFLMDQSSYVKDPRLLNAVLKLADLQWILDQRQLQRGLSSPDGVTVVTLLQFRMILVTEYACYQLSKAVKV